MDLVEIKEWVAKKDENQIFEIDKEYLKNIYNTSNQYLDRVNKKYEIPYSKLENLYLGRENNYKNKTLEGYHMSLIYSEKILNASSIDFIPQYIRKWNIALHSILDDFQLYDLQKALMSLKLHHLYDDQDYLTEIEYKRSKSYVIGELISFYDEYLSSTQTFNPDDEHWEMVLKEETENLWGMLNQFDKKIGFSKVFDMNDDDWATFYLIYNLIEKKNSELNKRPGGRDTKFDKLSVSIKELCCDINNQIINDIEYKGDNNKAEEVNTWRIAGNLMNMDKYQESYPDNYKSESKRGKLIINDQDGFNKFIKNTVFDRYWYNFNEVLDLEYIVKFNSKYYRLLPKN